MKLYLKDIEKFTYKSTDKYYISMDIVIGANHELITNTPKNWYLGCKFGQAAVYFLVKENEVVYIGKTINRQRIQGHRDKDFDYIYFIPTSKSIYSQLELNLIRKYTTKYNKTHINALP